MIKKLILCSVGVYINFVIFFLRINTQLKSENWDIDTELDSVKYKTNSKRTSDIQTVINGGIRHLSVENDSVNDRKRITSSMSDIYSQILESCYHGEIEEHCLSTCWNRTFEKGYKTADMNLATEREVPECNLNRLTDNCEAFRIIHGFESIKITHEEEKFPLAFAIKIYHLPNQAEQVLRTIYRKHNVYCIHIDQRADDGVLELFNKIGKCLKHVIVLQDMLSLVHASFSEVAAEIKCMQAMRNSGTSWKYYINLSEQDFPLKTNLEMVNILNIFDGVNDIETYDHPVYENWRLENRFAVHKNSLAQESAKSAFKYEIQFSKGNPSGIFSKQFIDFILQDDVANEIAQWLNDTYSPAENIWATLVTLPWAPGSYPVSVRHMISTYMSRAMIVSGDTPRCQGKFESALCVFNCRDIWWLQSRPELFATKFDSQYDQQVLNCLESWYRHKATVPNVSKINWNVYHKLPHMKYHRLNKYSMASREQRETIKRDWLIKHAKLT